jgi:hypothetical protein
VHWLSGISGVSIQAPHSINNVVMEEPEFRKGAWTSEVCFGKLILHPLCKAGPDTIHRLLQEDMMLEELVRKHGTRNWTVIAGGIHGRSGKSCRLRWVISARPGSGPPCIQYPACLEEGRPMSMQICSRMYHVATSRCIGWGDSSAEPLCDLH